ncbi:hypothetical protein [Rubritalea tangerina]|uniref:Uncharacterized protein n=1 Tax=Rubritalea tangerina TaxID=430798 RepID=A0ABW4Z7R3_9BACT
MQTSGFIALLGAIFISRLLNEKAYKSLSDEEKLRLMDGFSSNRTYSMIPLIVLIGAYFLLMKVEAVDKGILSLTYFLLLAVFIITRIVFNQRKLTSLNLPDSYKSKFKLSQIISLVGVAWFFYTIFSPLALS